MLLVSAFFSQRRTGRDKSPHRTAAAGPGPSTPRFSTVQSDDHVKTSLVNKVILLRNKSERDHAMDNRSQSVVAATSLSDIVR